MENPKFEVALTSAQFDIFMAALSNIHVQMHQAKSGEINLLENFVVKWDKEGVGFEVKANKV